MKYNIGDRVRYRYVDRWGIIQDFMEPNYYIIKWENVYKPMIENGSNIIGVKELREDKLKRILNEK